MPVAPQPTLEVVEAPPQAPAILKFADVLRFMPRESTMIMGIDLAELSAAPVIGKYRDRMIDSFPDDISQFQQRCGFDFAADLDWLMVGINESGKFLVALRGNFSQNQFEECMTNVPAGETALKISVDGALQVYDDGDGDQTLGFWPSAGVFVFGNNESADLLKVAVDQTESSVRVNELVSAGDMGATFWTVGEPTPAITAGMPVQGMGDFAVAIEVGSTVDLIADLNFDTEDKAKQAESMLQMGMGMAKGQPQMQPFKPIVDKIKISVTGLVVGISLLLTEDDIDLIENALSPMLNFGGPPPPTP